MKKLLHYLVEGLVVLLLALCVLLALWVLLQGHQELTRKCLEHGCSEMWCNYSETPVCP
jgi:hypothetical protein